MFLLPWSLSVVGKSLVSPGICDRILSSVQRSRTGNGTGSGRTLPDALVRSWSRGEVEVLQQRRKSLCQSLLLFRMATVFALSFVHLFWICFEGWDPPLHWGNCSCFWWMQILDDSLDFIGSSRPDCKPLNQAPLEKTRLWLKAGPGSWACVAEVWLSWGIDPSPSLGSRFSVKSAAGGWFFP